MALVEKLMKMREEMDRMKEKASRSEGALAQLQKRLKEEFLVDTEEEGEAKLKEMNTRILHMQNDLSEIVAELEQEYDWDEDPEGIATE